MRFNPPHSVGVPWASKPHFSSCLTSHPWRGRVGGRRGASRWELTAAAAGLSEVTIKLHQQYESPAAVVDFVLREWRPTFDEMATVDPANLNNDAGWSSSNGCISKVGFIYTLTLG